MWRPAEVADAEALEHLGDLGPLGRGWATASAGRWAGHQHGFGHGDREVPVDRLHLRARKHERSSEVGQRRRS